MDRCKREAQKGPPAEQIDSKKGPPAEQIEEGNVREMFGKCSGLARPRPIPSLRDSIEPRNRGTERERGPVGEGGENGKAARRAPSAVPDRMEVTAQMRRQAESYGVPADAIEFETEKFLDYYRDCGARKVDWMPAWRNWMRRVRDFGPRPPANGAGSTSPGSVGRTAQAGSSLERMLDIARGKG